MTQQRPSSHEPSALVQRGSPQLVTPPGTPDTSNFNESKLHQLLANFDSGTHSFCREERETAEERRKSFSSETRLTPPSSRRPSFLSGLTLSRPVFASQPNSGASTPIHTPLATSNPKDHHHHYPHNLAMTPSSSTDRHIRSNSTPSGVIPAEAKMLRSNTMSKMKAQSSEYPKGKAGQKAIGPAPGEEEKRHFDPSRDPKLLGLL